MSNVYSMDEQRKKMAADEATAPEPELPLFGGGGGGTSGGMDVVDAKIAAAEARTDTKFAKMEGKLDLIVSSLDSIKRQAADAKSEAQTTRRAIMTTVIGTGFSLAALGVAIFSLYANAFNLGSRVDDIAKVEAQQTYNQMAVEAANERARITADQPTKLLPAPGSNTIKGR